MIRRVFKEFMYCLVVLLIIVMVTWIALTSVSDWQAAKHVANTYQYGDREFVVTQIEHRGDTLVVTYETEKNRR